MLAEHQQASHQHRKHVIVLKIGHVLLGVDVQQEHRQEYAQIALNAEHQQASHQHHSHAYAPTMAPSPVLMVTNTGIIHAVLGKKRRKGAVLLPVLEGFARMNMVLF